LPRQATCKERAFIPMDESQGLSGAESGKRKRRHPTWACYHTVLGIFVQDKIEDGIVGRVVCAPFAVLVAEELFASR
jgi:hypothetical protein